MVKRIMFVLMLLGITLTLSACGTVIERFFNDVRSIEVDQDTLRDNYVAGNFMYDEIEIIVTRFDGRTYRINLEENMIYSPHRQRLEIDGNHRIRIVYGGASTTIDVKIVQREAI